jgi:phytoene/squalene synthetase
LGAAYQKVNFLRDFTSDYSELHRTYFPNVSYETFNDTDKQRIIKDIKNDFKTALPAIHALPESAGQLCR